MNNDLPPASYFENLETGKLAINFAWPNYVQLHVYIDASVHAHMHV